MENSSELIQQSSINKVSLVLLYQNLGSVIRKSDSSIHRIVIFSSFLKLSVDWYNPD
jgi:hypothetical protein